ncbi:MAG TPA: amidase, partial [Thermodesulfobacteriota bacterium]|nr:amidase [Thermodesulfobacteriota bacterium]
MTELRWMSAVELAAGIRKKKFSPVEVMRDLLSAIEEVNPKINAYVTIDAKGALAAARKAEKAVMGRLGLGPLHGVPLSVKDAAFTKGLRTTMGSRLMEDFIPTEDAEFVARLRRAGAIVVGKTNTPEFATVPYTENLLFGATRNPWNLSRSTGGSSGGAGAAVAAGLAPIATGNDVGGSIRIPASCCGVF